MFVIKLRCPNNYPHLSHTHTWHARHRPLSVYMSPPPRHLVVFPFPPLSNPCVTRLKCEECTGTSWRRLQKKRSGPRGSASKICSWEILKQFRSYCSLVRLTNSTDIGSWSSSVLTWDILSRRSQTRTTQPRSRSRGYFRGVKIDKAHVINGFICLCPKLPAVLLYLKAV